MRYYLTSALSIFFCWTFVYAQNFSNKGKDFWLGYGYHVSMSNSNGTVNTTSGGSQNMVLYFTSDKNANVTVEIPALNYSQTYSVIANQVTETSPLPKTGLQDARISDTGYFNRGIHIYSDNDIVAYAHIYASAVSGASLLFPTNTLGKEYYVISYNQSSNSNYANSFAFIVAVEDNTVVEITPSVANKNNLPVDTPYLVTLNKGQVYSLMGTVNGRTGTDLTGTRIRTISNAGTGCKKIAVFCGSGKMSIGGTSINNNQTGSADNLFAQALPASAWGLKYLTAPTGSQPSNYYRICVTDPSTVVKLNGAVIPSSYLQRSFFYEVKNNQVLSIPGNGIGVSNISGPNLIEADKPINVAQYCTTEGMDGNPSSPGDPEMIYLSPVEQTINKITLNSTPHYAITQHFINVVIKKGGVNSFTLDGASAANYFLPHPQDNNYAYAIFSVSQGSHALYSDTGFNAIAYGFGNAESYGYNAGTNIKDLYAPVFQNPFARISFAATCVNTPFQFSVPLSYQPTSLTWDFGSNPALTPNTKLVYGTPAYDSASVIGGQNLFYYSPANGAGSVTYSYSTPGSDTIKLYATNPTPDGCGSTNAEYDIPVTINATPAPNYLVVNNPICISDSLQFKDSSNNLGLSNVVNGMWYWNDGTKADTLKNPLHKFLNGGTYNIRYRPITDYGCIGDTTIPFSIASAGIPKFGVSDTTCANTVITFTDSSSIAVGSIVKWYWDYGDGTQDTLTNNSSRTKKYTSSGQITVSLVVENNSGCKSNAYTKTITIHPNPVTNFVLPQAVCLPVGAASFSDSTTISDGTASSFIYNWNFGDGGVDSIKNPTHYYQSVGPFNVKLRVVSQFGCINDSTKTLAAIYPQPKAGFIVSQQVCLRDTTVFSDGSDGKGSSVVKWNWQFGDGYTDTLQNTKHSYAAANTDSVKLWVVTDKGCVSDTALQTTVVNPLPVANFVTSAGNNYCEHRAITFADKAVNQAITPGSALTNWYWDLGDSTILSPTGGLNTTFDHTYASYGTYSVKMAVMNSLGCKSDTSIQSITINPLPHVGFINPEVCLADASAQFTDTSTIANGNTIAAYLWNFNAGSSAITPGPTSVINTVQNGSAHYNAVGNYVVSLKLTSNNGCDSTLSKPFTVNGSIPHADFVVLNDTRLCSNDSVRIQDMSTVDFGTVTKNEIFWDLANPADSIDQNPYTNKLYTHLYPDFQTPSSLTYQVKMVAHSGNSSVCVSSVVKTVTLNQSPKVHFTTIPGICNDTTARLISQASELGAVPGTFTFSGTGVSPGGLYTPQSVAAGTYPVKYVYTSPVGCADSATQDITVWPSPIAKWGVSSPLCEKNDLLFTDSSVANYSNIVERFWDFGDGTTANYSTSSSFAKQYAVGNTYAASLRVVTDSGCRSTYTSRNLKINYLPVVHFSMPSICLPDGRGTFTDQSTIADGTQDLFSYSWNFNDPSDPTPALIKNPIHKYSAVGPYDIQLKITTSAGCVDSLTQVLNTIYPQPHAAFQATPDTVCVNDNITFIDRSNGITSSPVSWVWDLAGTSSSQQNPSKQFTDSGSFAIHMYFYNGQGCVSDTAIQSVTVYPYPKLTLGNGLFVLEGGSVPVIPQYVYGTNLQYMWSPATYLNSDTAMNPVASPVDDITYTLKLTGIGGCSVSDNIFIKVLRSPVIPNAFSPNNDGINDTWKIRYLESYPGAT
ncbi:MAG: PKD domain-containing protein, partial [Bacteroidota bacterium]|nr:PKD domain-containing protein [Bacteroidota bacterium]